MFYKFLNKRISKKISELHPISMRYLSNDIEKNYDETIAKRLETVRNYAILHKHFEIDQKRLYMINKNYLNFIKAIIFLYQTSQISISGGILTAPASVYHTIIAVQNSFEKATKSLTLK